MERLISSSLVPALWWIKRHRCVFEIIIIIFFFSFYNYYVLLKKIKDRRKQRCRPRCTNCRSRDKPACICFRYLEKKWNHHFDRNVNNLSPESVWWQTGVWDKVDVPCCHFLSWRLKCTMSPLIHLYILYGNMLLIHDNVTPTFNPIQHHASCPPVLMCLCVYFSVSLSLCFGADVKIHENKSMPMSLTLCWRTL